MSKRVYAFAGTRHPLTDDDKAMIRMILLIDELDDAESWDEWHHGGAKTGVDPFIHQLGQEWGYRLTPHPAAWDRYGKQAGPIRNRAMLDAALPLRLYAFPSSGKYGRLRSIGTVDCIQAAIDRSIDLRIHWL